jgi:hypothetical protein
MCGAIILFAGTAKSQLVVSTPTILMSDTLHYYFNKFHFKTGLTLKDFPYYKAAASTVTNVTHMGNKFENQDTLEIFGLEGFATRNPSSAQLSIKVHLYLCTLDVNGKPKLPALDSVISIVNSSSNINIGGPLLHGMKKVTGDFAVLIRNMSTISGDTVRIYRTAAKTFTSNAPWDEKYSDGFGFVRNNGVFYSATNYTATGFGQTTDYEFLVAPIVRYNIWAAHEIPAKIANTDPSNPLCTQEVVTFTNKSAKQWTHRMYNLNEFYRKWNYHSQFKAAPSGGWPADSAITWYFEANDGEPLERVFLPYCNSFNGCTNQVQFWTANAKKDSFGDDSVTCYPDNAFRARFRGMGIYGSGQILDTRKPTQAGGSFDTLIFTICTSFCGKDNVGIKTHGELKNIKLYPNPAADGLTAITGLRGKNQVFVYNMTGQLIFNEVSEQNTLHLDLRKQAQGSYLVKIINLDNQATKTHKILIE